MEIIAVLQCSSVVIVVLSVKLIVVPSVKRLSCGFRCDSGCITVIGSKFK